MKKKRIIICSFVLTILIAIISTIMVMIYKENTAVPTIALIGEDTVKLSLNQIYEEQGATAFLQENDVSGNVEIAGEVDTAKTGEYTLKYTVSNSKNKNPVTIFIFHLGKR